jgi:hypothetical protein
MSSRRTQRDDDLGSLGTAAFLATQHQNPPSVAFLDVDHCRIERFRNVSGDEELHPGRLDNGIAGFR